MKVDILRNIFQNICCIVFIYGSSTKAQMTIRGFNFLRDNRFDDFVLNHGLIWQMSTNSVLACAVNCVGERACMSFHFHRGSGRCRGYETLMLTTDAGMYEEDWRYFYMTYTGNVVFCTHSMCRDTCFNLFLLCYFKVGNVLL